MNKSTKSPLPQAAPWTGGLDLGPDKIVSLAGENLKRVIGGRNLPGPPEKTPKGKRVRIPRSNHKSVRP